MSDPAPKAASPERRRMEISIWDNEGGAGPCGPGEAMMALQLPIPELSNTDLVQLRVRVIALENLVLALLAGAPETLLERARAFAYQISPRAGVTQHPLTLQAARQMNELVNRAQKIRK